MKATLPSVIDQKYRVLKELGRGGAGVIYLADYQGQKVAIKCQNPNRLPEHSLKRLKHEFVVLRSLAHPHIAQPIDFGVEEGMYFIVTEFVEGETLDRYLKKVSSKQSLEFLYQTLEALSYMHRQDVYHCDLKPANILVTKQGQLKIIDFDVATQGTRVIGGTPSYAAPEILARTQSRPNDRTDLFSLGCTFYDALTGQPPFVASHIDELQLLHRTAQIRPPSELNPQLDVYWDDILMSLLAIHPSERFATATAVLQQIQPLLQKQTVGIPYQDIHYRLKQQGPPVAREKLMAEAKAVIGKLSDPNEKRSQTWVLEGASGLGSSYVCKEIKAMAQVAGLSCYTADSHEVQWPEQEPFVWFIDDWGKTSFQKRKEVLAKLNSYWSSSRSSFWIVLTGLESLSDLPANWQPRFFKPFQLQPWTLLELQSGVNHLFQTDEVPDFLSQKLFQESQGNPGQAMALLNYYLDKNLLFDDQGHWKKELFQPTAFYKEQLTDPGNQSRYQALKESLSQTELDVLWGLSLAHGSLPYDFLVDLKSENRSALSHLKFLGLVTVSDSQSCFLTEAGLGRYFKQNENELSLRQKHDLWLKRTQDKQTIFNLSQEIRHHKARGSDDDLAFQAWSEWGLDFARQGLWESAYQAYDQALKRLSKKSEQDVFKALVERDKFLGYLKNKNEARDILEKRLKEYAHLKEKCASSFARLYERLALIQLQSSQVAKARGFFQQGIAVLEHKQEPLEQYLGLQNFVAATYMLEKDYDSAIDIFKTTYQRAQLELNENQKRVLTNNDLAQALLKKGELQQAREHWLSLIKEYQSKKDQLPLARACYQLAQTYSEEREAKEYLHKALKALESTQNFDLKLRVLNALANSEREHDEEQALKYYEEALHWAFQVQNSFTIGGIFLNMGTLLTHQKSRAKHCLSQGLYYLEQVPNIHDQQGALLVETYLNLCDISLDLKQKKSGQEAFDRACKIWQKKKFSKFNQRINDVQRRLDRFDHQDVMPSFQDVDPGQDTIVYDDD